MSHNYQDWAHLNDEGMKELGDVFPEGVVPIISMLPITFKHPQLATPEKGYLLRGSDLTEDQVKRIIDKLSAKFNAENQREEIKKTILSNNIPVREKLTSGTGTRRPYVYMADDLDEDEEYDDEDWDEDEEVWE